jgi:hypothetical protein
LLSSTIAFKSRFVAATNRTSVRIVRLPPRRSKLLVLDGAQQLRLELDRHLADLVEK